MWMLLAATAVGVVLLLLTAKLMLDGRHEPRTDVDVTDTTPTEELPAPGQRSPDRPDRNQRGQQ